MTGIVTVVNRYKPVALPNAGSRLYVGRPTTLGNPYRSMRPADRDATVEKYEAWLRQRMRTVNPVSTEMYRLAEVLKEGWSLQLECSCAPKRCHADIIKLVLEEILEGKHAV